MYQWLWNLRIRPSIFLFERRFLLFLIVLHVQHWNIHGYHPTRGPNLWLFWGFYITFSSMNLHRSPFDDQAKHLLHLICQHLFRPKSEFEEMESERCHFPHDHHGLKKEINVSKKWNISDCYLHLLTPKTTEQWMPKRKIRIWIVVMFAIYHLLRLLR